MNHINRYIPNMVTKIFFFLAFILLITSSCTNTDDALIRNGKGDTSISLKLLGAGSNREDDIKTLNLIAFDNTSGALVFNKLVYDKTGTNGQSAENTSINFNFPVATGTYKMYFIANAKKDYRSSNNLSPLLYKDAAEIDLLSITTEADLKKIVLNYNGKLPINPFVMITDGPIVKDITEGQINSIGDVCLKYTCTKINFNIGYKKGEYPDFKINSLSLKNLSGTSNLMEPGERGSNLFNIASLLPALVIEENEAGDSIYHKGVYYIPEAKLYPAGQITAKEFSQLVINYDKKGGTGLTKTIDLIDDKLNPTTPRGREYILLLNKIIDAGLDINVVMLPWTTQDVCLDILGDKYLSLSKIYPSVTTFAPDSIEYTTNATSFSWEILGYETNPLEAPFNIDKRAGKNTLLFEQNLSFDLTKGIDGDVQVRIIADNLSKIITVHYDYTPMLSVNPVEVVIELQDGVSQVIAYKTNMPGGIKVTPVKVDPNLGLNINDILVTTNGIKSGDITFTYTGNQDIKAPLGKYYFEVETNTKIGSLPGKVVVDVTVKPKTEGWRIYFKAINELVNNSNWIDGIAITDEIADNNGWRNSHYAYIYTQLGPLMTGNDNIWLFTGPQNWPGLTMDAVGRDGWYSYDLANAAVEDINNKAAIAPKFPKPGETLVMFNSNNVTDNTRHRYPYHEQPGIPLFDFVDHDGWFVYDPTATYYEFYDNEPTVINITYTVYVSAGYSQVPEIRWKKNYGLNFDLFSPFYTMTQVSPGVYKYDFVLKSLSDNKEKDIELEIKRKGCPGDPIISIGKLYDGLWGSCYTGDASAVGYYSTATKSWMTSQQPVPPAEVCPLNPPANDSRRIYFYNTNNWSEPWLHYWRNDGGTENGDLKMNYWTDNWYYVDIRDFITSVLFFEVGWASQTPNQHIKDLGLFGGSNQNRNLYYKNATWSTTKP